MASLLIVNTFTHVKLIPSLLRDSFRPWFCWPSNDVIAKIKFPLANWLKSLWGKVDRWHILGCGALLLYCEYLVVDSPTFINLTSYPVHISTSIVDSTRFWQSMAMSLISLLHDATCSLYACGISLLPLRLNCFSRGSSINWLNFLLNFLFIISRWCMSLIAAIKGDQYSETITGQCKQLLLYQNKKFLIQEWLKWTVGIRIASYLLACLSV